MLYPIQCSLGGLTMLGPVVDVIHPQVEPSRKLPPSQIRKRRPFPDYFAGTCVTKSTGAMQNKPSWPCHALGNASKCTPV